MIQKKVCLLGMFGVGKTSLVRRFVNQIFDEKYHTTIGVKVDHKFVALRPEGVNLLLWDIAGQETGPITENYFHGAHGALLVHDLTRPESAQALEEYCERFLRIAPRAKLVVIGNKSDLVEIKNFDETEVRARFASKGTAFFLTSAKTGENVEAAFEKLAQLLTV